MNGLAYQNEYQDEMLDGKLTAMYPRPAVNHNIVAGNVYHIFKQYLRGKVCVVLPDGTDVYLTQKDRIIPDLMVVCNRSIIKPNAVYGTPDLIAEVLSPGTANRDRGYKKDLYERCGVKEYWLAEAAARTIEVYLLKDGQLKLDNVYTVYPDYMLENMTAEEIEAIPRTFSPSIFPDMKITVSDVFEGLIL